MNSHKLRGLTAVHACIQYKSLQSFKQLTGLIIPFLSERLKQIHKGFFQVSALNLNIDAACHHSQLILGENSFVREDIFHKRPGFSDKPEAVSCAFDAVNTGNMENTHRLVFLQGIKKLCANRLVKVFIFIAELFAFQDNGIAFIVLNNFDYIYYAVFNKFIQDFIALACLNMLCIKYGNNVSCLNSGLLAKGICQALVSSHK